MKAPLPDSKKIALITGTSRRQGIGAAVALAFAEAEIDIFLTYYRPYDATMPWGEDSSGPEQLLADLRQKGVRAAGVELDLSRPEGIAGLFDRVEEHLGPVSILVNNATHSETGGIEQLTAAQLDAHYAVNIRAMALLCVEYARRFQGNWGRIVNLTSGQGVGPMPEELAYAATKGAVEAFTVSLSRALAPRQITVNAVDPGATDTGWMTPQLKHQLKSAGPMGRIGQPEDAARLIRFLASEEAGWITGQIIHSRGGL